MFFILFFFLISVTSSKEHVFLEGETSHYLIPLGEKNEGFYMLVDTPREHVLRKFLGKLKKTGLSVKDIKFVLITHHHHDHAGSIDRLIEMNPEIKIIVSELAKDFLSSGNGLDSDFQSLNFFVKFFRAYAEYFQGVKTYEMSPFEIREGDILIQPNQWQSESNDPYYRKFLHEIGLHGKIISTPGHSRDSISLILDNGNSYVGDLVMNFPFTLDYFLSWNKRPVIFQDLEEVYNSWKYLKDHGATTIFPGHGPKCSAELDYYIQRFNDDL